MDIPLLEEGEASVMAQTETSRFLSLYHFALLIWKGFLLRKRHFIVTIIELFIPILISSIPVIVHAESMKHMAESQSRYQYRVKPTTDLVSRHRDATYYDPFDPRLRISNQPSRVHLLFAPDTSLSSSLTNGAVKFMKEKANVEILSIVGVRTEADLEDEALKIQINYNNGDYAIIGLVYSNFGEDVPGSLNYKIRYGTSHSYFFTGSKYPPFKAQPPYERSNAYLTTPFLAVQASVDHAFINMRSDNKIATKVMMQSFPYPPYLDLTSNSPLIDLPGMFLSFGFIVLNIIVVKRVIDEKSNRSKELLKMMGMTDCIYWSSTFMNFFIISIVMCLIMTILYKVVYYGVAAYLPETDPFLLLILLLMISASTILFCFVVTTFINRPVLGIVIMITIWTVSSSLLLAFVFVQDKYMYLNLISRLAVCLIPTGSILVVFRFLTTMESCGEGSLWSNLNSFIVTPDQNLAMVMAVILLSCVIYCVLIWYIDAVCPWQYGVPKPFYFPFTKSYWCGERNKTVEEEVEGVDSREYFEEEPTGSSPGIVVDHLTKVFRRGLTTKVAVDDLSMKIYNGQITAVLGHNGAGKTTTINMLTGLYPPTRGTASIDGWDILTQIKSARRSLGICPQHSVLYDTLTVEEHLKLYAGLKGVKWSAMSVEATEVLRLLRLEDKAKELSKNLSGGMKRKLALGIAIIGGSKVLFLDEPTSGMDPEARRGVWDMLLSIRTERTIVLTTHYMEEADILGDRIAIIADGRLRCYGSPMFLKQKFGTGYHLHLTTEPECVLDGVTCLLKNYVPEASLESSMEREVTYSFLGSDPAMYGKMFEELERQKVKLGIGSFGMSVTTMEDVFIKVTETATDEAVKENGGNKVTRENSDEVLILEDESSSGNSEGHNVFVEFPRTEGLPLLLQQVKGLLLKRLHHTKRHWSVFLTKLVYPFVINLVMLYVMYTVQAPRTEKPLALDLKEVYGSSKGFYHYNNTEAEEFAEYYMKTVLQSLGVDAKYVPDPTNFIVKYGENNLLPYINDLLIGGSASLDTNTLFVKAWYNPVPYHTAPMTLNMMDTALLRYISGSKQASIKVKNAPLQFSNVHQRFDLIFARLIAAGFLPLSLAYMSSSFIYVPVYENVSKSKLLQLMTGVSTLTYWSMMFVWDILVYCACTLILLIPFGIYNANALGSAESIGTIVLTYLLYGWSSIPLCYLASLVFKKPSTGFGALVGIKVILALVSAVILAVLVRVIPDNHDVKTAMWFLHLLPTFGATWGLMTAFEVSFSNSYCDSISQKVLTLSCPTLKPSDNLFKCCKDYCGQSCFNKTNLLSWGPSGCGREVTFLFLDGILYFAILLLLETHSVRRLFQCAVCHLLRKKTITVQPNTNSNFQDDDVISEANRVTELQTDELNDEALLVLGLTKYYTTICAVDHLKFGVHLKECFGLLGINGAGKTSTFKMLTGDIEPTEGNAFLKDSNLCDSVQKFQKFLGYCPQYDALVDRLSGREMLTLFARLRGIPENSIDNCVSEFINMVDLQDYSEKPTKVYSGGNKRKLSLALALIGNPPLILLDEPTCGVDPVARRKIWNVLSKVRTISGSSIILTTHSMEESEALCSRLAIMVNGVFRCMGSIQHLKSKFGQGFTVIAKLKKEQLVLDPFMTYPKRCLQEAFPSASLKDDHQGMLTYHISDTSVTWSQLFNKMEELKQTLQLDDYQISDTTLEQIFLAFARNQRITEQVCV